MHRLALAAALTGFALSAAADPAFGPDADLNHLDGLEWLADGVLFCVAGECPTDTLLYLVADPAKGHLDAYTVTDDIDDDANPTPGAPCTVIGPFLKGPIYGTAEATLYAAEVISPDTILSGILFVAGDFSGLADTPGAPLRYALADTDGLTAAQEALLSKVSDGDLAPLRDPEWPALWSLLAGQVSSRLAQSAIEVTYYHRTTPEERAFLLGKQVELDSNGAPKRPLTPGDCLPSSLVSGPPG